MKNKIIQSIPTFLALFFIGFRFFSKKCILASPSCHDTWIHEIYFTLTNPFFSFATPFILIALTLIFVPRNIFKSWLKLAVWTLPLAFLYIAWTPVSWTGIGLNLSPFYRDDAARVAGGVFTVTSLVVVVFDLIRIRLSKRYELEEVSRKMKEFTVLAAIGSGIIAIGVLFWANATLSLGSFFLAGLVLVLSNLYVLGYAAVGTYQGARAHTPFVRTLLLALSLLIVSAVSVLVLFSSTGH